MSIATPSELIAPIRRLDRDLREAAKMLTDEEARYLVDLFYASQEYRKRAANQTLASGKVVEPNELVKFVFDQFVTVEQDVKRALDSFTDGRVVGQWAKTIYGIGPVISAGLLAHIDIERATNPSKITRFAGLDPTLKWLGTEKAAKLVREARDRCETEGGTKGDWLAFAWAMNEANANPVTILRLAGLTDSYESLPPTTSFSGLAGVLEATFSEVTVNWTSVTKALAKRPYNSRLKVLCWKIGDSFVKFHNKDECMYGHLYAQRKAVEVEKNLAGDFAALAEKTLEEKRIAEPKTLAAYKAGMLPDGRIDLRARRFAVKIFLSHWWVVAYESHHGRKAPDPWILTPQGGHSDRIPVPNWDGRKITS